MFVKFMLIKQSNILDISHLKPAAISCFLTGSLAGRRSIKQGLDKKILPILARLIDKAIEEYNCVKELVEAEEVESGMSYKDILKRNQGQFIYTCAIINHLENCITTLARIYKVKEKYFGHAKNQDIMGIRNSVEHVEDRIRDVVDEPPVLNILNDSLVVEVAARDCGKIFVKTKDIAEEIDSLYVEIRELLSLRHNLSLGALPISGTS